MLKKFCELINWYKDWRQTSPQTLEESQQMLALAYAGGTRHSIATLHFNFVGYCSEIGLLQERMTEAQQEFVISQISSVFEH